MRGWWPVSREYPLIALQRPGHSNFILLWDFNDTWRENLADRWMWIRGKWSVGSMEGFGCICGWQTPIQRVWPLWFWHHWWWYRHVRVCSLPRDEFGNVIR